MADGSMILLSTASEAWGLVHRVMSQVAVALLVAMVLAWAFNLWGARRW